MVWRQVNSPAPSSQTEAGSGTGESSAVKPILLNSTWLFDPVKTAFTNCTLA